MGIAQANKPAPSNTALDKFIADLTAYRMIEVGLLSASGRSNSEDEMRSRMVA